MASNPTWIASPDQLGSSPPNVVHAMIEALIEWCDEQDGDPDFELAGDETDGSPPDDPIFPKPGERGFDFFGAAGEADDAEDDDPLEATWRETTEYQPQTVGFLHPRSPDDAEEGDDDQCAGGDDDLSSWGRWAGPCVRWTGPDRTPGDPEDAEDAWVERVNQDRPQPAKVPGVWSAHEDAEDDDPGGGTGMEDEFDTRTRGRSGAGCPIADPGGCEHDGREEEYSL